MNIKAIFKKPKCIHDNTVLERIVTIWKNNHTSTYYGCPTCFRQYVSLAGNKIKPLNE